MQGLLPVFNLHLRCCRNGELVYEIKPNDYGACAYEAPPPFIYNPRWGNRLGHMNFYLHRSWKKCRFCCCWFFYSLIFCFCAGKEDAPKTKAATSPTSRNHSMPLWSSGRRREKGWWPKWKSQTVPPSIPYWAARWVFQLKLLPSKLSISDT